MEILNLPEFFINFSNAQGKEKITIGPIENGKHLTFHFGTKSKVFDIHFKTDEKNNIYDTIIQISHYSLFRLWIMTRNELDVLFSNNFYSKINLGKLKKYNSICFPINQDLFYLNYIKLNTKKTKIKLQKTIDIDSIYNNFIDMNHLDSACNTYYLYRIRKCKFIKNGIIIRNIDSYTNNSFVYLSNKSLNKMKTETIKVLKTNLKKLHNTDCTKLLELLNNNK